MRSLNVIKLYSHEVVVDIRNREPQTKQQLIGLALVRAVSASILLCVSDWSLSETTLDKVASEQHEPVVIDEMAGVLVNKRLFFDVPYIDETSKSEDDASARIVSENRENTALGGLVPEDKDTSKATGVNKEHSLKQHDVAKKSAAEKVPHIHYEAHVRSQDTIRIIINSLPCQALDTDLLHLSSSGTSEIHCDGLAETDIRIELLADKQQLQITRRTQVLGILSPGEKL